MIPSTDTALRPAETGPAGRFITLEGLDGAGKTTHVEALVTRWHARGLEVVRTREPGGTPLAESLRNLFLHESMDALTEALLVFAARRDHLIQVITPALARGAVVLCDRYTDATFAYQGGGRGFDLEVLTHLEQWVQQGRAPDLTLWFDLPPELAARRRGAARPSDRLEAESIAFFQRVATGYAARAAGDPARFARIDASLGIAEVARQVEQVLESKAW